MNLRRIFSDALVSSSRILAALLRAIVVIPIFTNVLGADGYGIWAALMVTIELFASTGGLHLHGALIRFAPDNGLSETFSDILSLGTIAAIGSGSLFWMIAMALPLSNLLGGEVQSANIAAVGGLLIATRILSDIVINYPRADNQVKLYELLYISRTTIEIAAIVIAVLVTPTVLAAAIALASVWFASLLLIPVFGRHAVTRPSVARFGEYLRYGVPMAPSEISGTLLTHADKYIILWMLSPAATGIYTVAYNIVRFFPQVGGVFNSTLYPNISAAWENDKVSAIQDFYSIFFRGYAILMIPAAVGISLLAEPALQFLSTPEIAAKGKGLIPILVVGLLIQGVEYPVSYIFTSAKRTEVIAKLTFLSVLVNLILNILLIPSIGLKGAATATLTAQVIKTALLIYYSRRFVPLSLPIHDIGRATFSTAIMAAVLSLVPTTGLSPLTHLIVHAGLGASVYIVILSIIGGIRHRDIESIRHLIQ